MNYAVIGAMSGLGLTLAKHMLTEGENVYATTLGMNTDLQELQTDHKKTFTLEIADITDEEAMESFAKKIKEAGVVLDAVCITAGINADSDRTNNIPEINIEDLRKTFEVNTVGPIIAAKVLTPLMKEGGKIFIVTSEGVGLDTLGTWIPAYSLSKTAATKAAGLFNQANTDVDYFAVHPGRMNTDLGRTTAQIEPEEAASGIYQMMSGSKRISRDDWYIDYQGNRLGL